MQLKILLKRKQPFANNKFTRGCFKSVPRTRLELACRNAAPAPQAGVSTNFTIWAFIIKKRSIQLLN